MMTQRLAALGLATAIALVAHTPAVADAGSWRSLKFGSPLATLPGADGSDQLDAVRTDRAGHLFVVSGNRIATFSQQGSLLREWSLPGTNPATSYVLADTSPDGRLYAAALNGNTVYEYDAGGTLLGSWSGRGGDTVNGVQQLAVDPRGSVLISDQDEFRSLTSRPKRFSLAGRYLGRSPGGTGKSAVAPTGVRWVISGTAVDGYTSSGRAFQEVGRDCPIDQTSATSCPSGIGAFGVAPPSDLATGPNAALAALETSINRIQVFNRSGRLLVACRMSGTHAYPTSITFARRGGGLLVAAGQSVFRAHFSSRRTGSCRQPRLAISGVHVRRTSGTRREWTVRYHLSRRAHVQLVLQRVRHTHCKTSPSDRFDPEHGCERLVFASRRGVLGRHGWNRRRLTLPKGRWLIQVEAVDANFDSADAVFRRFGP